jgi:hypothetical protein
MDAETDKDDGKGAKVSNGATLHLFNTHMQSSMFNAPHHQAV